MRKLVFMLRVNPNPNVVTPKNLEISTHRGARLLIIGNQATVLDVTNDEMSDSELQTWYRSRYAGMGMGITIMHDKDVEVGPANENKEEIAQVKVEESEIKVEQVKTVAASEKSVEANVADNVMVSASANVVVSTPEPIAASKSEVKSDLYSGVKVAPVGSSEVITEKQDNINAVDAAMVEKEDLGSKIEHKNVNTDESFGQLQSVLWQ